MSEQEQVILRAIAHVGRGGLAEISKVVRAVGYPKATTKKVLISLAGKGIVFLHRHDYPSSLSPAERKLMVHWKGSYYNAVSARQKNQTSRFADLSVGEKFRVPSFEESAAKNLRGVTLVKISSTEARGPKKQIYNIRANISVLRVNPRGQHLPGLPKKAQREYEHVLSSELAMGRSVKRAKGIAAGKVRKDYGRNPKTKPALKYKVGRITVSIWQTPEGKYTATWTIPMKGSYYGHMLGVGPLGPHQYNRRKFDTIEEAKSAADVYVKNPKRKRNQSTYYVVYEGSVDGGSFYDERWDKLEDAKEFVRQKKERALSRGYDVGWWQWIIYRRPGSGLVSYRTSTGQKNPARKKNTTVIKAKRVVIKKVLNPQRNSARFNATQWANEMGRLRDIKPRPLVKLYGKSGGTPEQQAAWKQDMAEWNKQYRHASKMQKIALEEDNAAYRAKQAQNPKRKRNLDHRDSKHQVKVHQHWRAGGLSQWQRAHKAGQHDLFAHGIKARNPSAGDSAKWEKLWSNYIKALKDHDAGLAKLRGKVSPEFRAVRMRLAKAEKAIQKFDPDAYKRYVLGRKNPLIQPGRRYKMKPDYEPTAIIEAGMRGGFKAVFIAKDGLAGQVGGFKTRAEASAWAKAQGFKVVQKTKKRNAARSHHPKSAKTSRAGASRSGRKTRSARGHKRNAATPSSLIAKAVKRVIKRNPSAPEIRKNFAGRYNKDDRLIFPDGTPQGLAKLGRLVSISTESGKIKPVKGVAWLCSDTRGKLHLGTPTKGHVLFSGPAHDYGRVREIEYQESKPHLGYAKQTLFFHKLGEKTGEKPRLVTDGKGGAKFVGGAYQIRREGIIN